MDGAYRKKKKRGEIVRLTTTLSRFPSGKRLVCCNSPVEAELITSTRSGCPTKAVCRRAGEDKSEILAQQTSISDSKEPLAQAEAPSISEYWPQRRKRKSPHGERETPVGTSTLSLKLAGIQQEWMGKASISKTGSIQSEFNQGNRETPKRTGPDRSRISLWWRKNNFAETIEVSEAKKTDLRKNWKQ